MEKPLHQRTQKFLQGASLACDAAMLLQEKENPKYAVQIYPN
jgi:hypothetical protein